MAKRTTNYERKQSQEIAALERVKVSGVASQKMVFGGEPKAAKSIPAAITIIDKLAKRGVIHKNKAANLKRMLAKKANALTVNESDLLAAFKRDNLPVIVMAGQDITKTLEPGSVLKEQRNTNAILDTKKLTCLVTGVSTTKVKVEALIDKKYGITQTRSFDKLPLEGVINCKEGVVFNLTIVTQPGSREFIYEPGNPDDIKFFVETLVDTTSLQNDLKNDPVFQKGPDVDDGNTF
jgi:ribosomal protein S20